MNLDITKSVRCEILSRPEKVGRKGPGRLVNSEKRFCQEFPPDGEELS